MRFRKLHRCANIIEFCLQLTLQPWCCVYIRFLVEFGWLYPISLGNVLGIGCCAQTLRRYDLIADPRNGDFSVRGAATSSHGHNTDFLAFHLSLAIISVLNMGPTTNTQPTPSGLDGSMSPRVDYNDPATFRNLLGPGSKLPNSSLQGTGRSPSGGTGEIK